MPLVHSCALAFPRKEMNQTKCNQLSRNVIMYCYFPTSQFCRGGLSYSSRTVVLSFHIHLISCDFILLMYFFVYQTLPNWLTRSLTDWLININIRDRSLFICGGGGVGGEKSWGGPGLLFREKGWAKREFHDDWGWVIVCFVKNHTHYNSCGRSK